jgi:nucleotide-binding universal stress UspA family protein
MRILLAIDGSACSDRARDLVAGTTWPDGTTIRIVAALEHGPALFGVPWLAVAPVDSNEIETGMAADLESVLAAAAERVAATGRTVVHEVLRGRPASAVTDDARAFGPDLIVVGSRGHGQLESMLLGSTSAEIVDHAPCPVLVARSDTVHTLLVAEDGSVGAREAIDFLARWPVWRECPATVLSVSDVPIPIDTGVAPGMYGEMLDTYSHARHESAKLHERLAQSTAALLSEAGLAATPDARAGDAATLIVRVAGERKADLIVMGTRGRTGLTRIILGSVARNVLLHAHCSVLIAREHRHAADVHEEEPVASARA